MDDTELHRERILRHAGPVITGNFLGFGPSYTREVEIRRPLVLAVVMAATVTYAVGALLLSLLRTGSMGARRTFKELKKGPEFLVTPLRLKDDEGRTYEVEMHGHLPQSALHRGDLIQIRTRPQRDERLPVRLVQVINLNTLQPLTPRIPTMWSHLGPALMIQAGLGLLVVLAVLILWMR